MATETQRTPVVNLLCGSVEFCGSVVSSALLQPVRARRTGQSTVEYALIVAAVVAAMAAMSTYVRRAVQANFKQLESAVNGAVNE